VPKPSETQKKALFFYTINAIIALFLGKKTHTQGGSDGLEKYLFLFSTFFKYLYFASKNPARV